MEDRRAHDRIDSLEDVMRQHLGDHERFERQINAISENTSELVELVRGMKGLRTLVIWAAPLVAAFFAVVAYLKGAK